MLQDTDRLILHDCYLLLMRMKDGVLYHPEHVSLDVSSQTRVGRLTVFVGLVAFQAHARLHSSHDDVVLFLRGQLVLRLIVLLLLDSLYFSRRPTA